MQSVFSSKILLFGEYTVINGGVGLAIPFNKYAGNWSFDKFKPPYCDQYKGLLSLVDYISNSKLLSKFIDVDRFRSEIEQGLCFDSSIPCGHGLGSSGALCAATLFRFGQDIPRRDTCQIEEILFLKDILSLMESYYHGASSGIDPLISYLARPLKIIGKNQIVLLDQDCFDAYKKQFYLLDSGRARNTAPLVELFLEKCNCSNYVKDLAQLRDINEVIIHKVLSQNLDLEEEFKTLSSLEYQLLGELIPEGQKAYWKIALEDSDYPLMKLCGAGGGGHFLLYAKGGKKLKGAQQLISLED